MGVIGDGVEGPPREDWEDKRSRGGVGGECRGEVEKLDRDDAYPSLDLVDELDEV